MHSAVLCLIVYPQGLKAKCLNLRHWPKLLSPLLHLAERGIVSGETTGQGNLEFLRVLQG